MRKVSSLGRTRSVKLDSQGDKYALIAGLQPNLYRQ